jgi:6-phosphogluconolactonase (cycloisomerase 2 family)
MKLRTLACLSSVSGILAIAACGSDDNAAPGPGPGQDASFDGASSGTSGSSGASGSSGTSGSSSGADTGTSGGSSGIIDSGKDSAEAGYTGPAHFLYAIGKAKDLLPDGAPAPVGVMGMTLDPTTGGLAPFDTDAVTPGVQTYVPAGNEPSAGAVTPNGKYLYVANTSSASVSGYSVDTTTGALSFLGSTSVVLGGGGSPTFLLTDAAGKRLYVSKQSGASIAIFDINAATGALTPQTPAEAPTGQIAPRGMALSLAGDYLFVANSGSDTVTTFNVDATTGALSNPKKAGAAGSPLAIIHHPTQKVIYVTAANGQGVYAFQYDAAGTLTEFLQADGGLQTVDNGPQGGVVDPSGKFLYVVNAALAPAGGGGYYITAFPLDAAGALVGTPVKTSLGTHGGGRGLVLDPDGKFLVLSGDVDLVATFAIGAGGTLTATNNTVRGAAGSYFDPIIVAH